MKLLISFVTALSLGLTCTVLGDDEYSALAAKAYRWVTVNGPYACKTKQDVERITAHHTDAAELQVVENIECYYPIPGTIVQVIKEDPARGLSEMRLGSITRSLWTGGPRFMCYLYNDHHYYPIYAGWLGGVCGWLSRNAG
jgi:hypothetical protein